MTAALQRDPSCTPREGYGTLSLPGSTDNSPLATPGTISARGIGFNFEPVAPLNAVEVVGSTDVTQQVAARVEELRKSISVPSSMAPRPDPLFERKLQRQQTSSERKIQYAKEHADLSSRLGLIVGVILALAIAVIVVVVLFAHPKN